VSRYVVTGCAGFIGSHLTELLLARGDEVVGVDSFSDYYARADKEANLASARPDPRFRLVAADLAEVDVAPLLDGAAGVFHLAAQPGVRSSWGDSFAIYLKDNILATQRLFEAAMQRDVRVVMASTSSIYGNAEAYPTREDAVPQPVSPYGVTKVACERLASVYAGSFGLDVVSMRYFTVYGPRQRPDMAFTRLLTALIEGTAFPMYGTGEQSRDFTFVDDAVDATARAMTSGVRGRIYNVGGGSEASMNAVVRLCEDVSGDRLDVRYEGVAAGDVRRTAADTTLIRTELGWAPGTSLRDGLSAQLAWLRERRAAPVPARD
jgi:UDP-glucuronate 4-epimerase